MTTSYEVKFGEWEKPWLNMDMSVLKIMRNTSKSVKKIAKNAEVKTEIKTIINPWLLKFLLMKISSVVFFPQKL